MGVHQEGISVTSPYERVLECEEVSEEAKERLREEYEMLNPAALRRKLPKLQDKLIKLATSSRRRTHVLEWIFI